jgi:hypothetical protein
MFIFYKEVDLEEGFELAKLDKNVRVLAGREVSNASGIKLFESLRGQPIKCWSCGCEADRWISCRGQNDKSRPVLNLFATFTPKKTRRNKHPVPRLVMMTRDHIIPKSKGGVDDIENLRPGCELCNVARGNNMNAEDIAFMEANPHLISQERLLKAQAVAAKHAAKELAYAQETAARRAKENDHANQS